MIVKLKAHAKVNLYLRVDGRRPDGFHEIETVLHNVALSDGIVIEPAPAAALHLEVAGPFAGAIDRADNLVLRAARALGVPPDAGARIRLDKHIPVAAGLGGGSADAAATLVGLDRLWSLRTGPARLSQVAASVGSDVPFFLTGGTAIARGRGERVSPVRVHGRFWFVLGTYLAGLSTAAVYAAWTPESEQPEPAETLVAALEEGDAHEVARRVHNDLEAPATLLRPELRGAKDAMVAAGAIAAAVSGSGPSVFGLTAGEAEARAVAARVASVFDRVAVVSTSGVGIEESP